MTDERKGNPSASAAARFYNCPGSHTLEAGQPDASTPEATTGTRIHAAWEKDDATGLDVNEREIFEDGNNMLANLIAKWGSM